MNTFGFRAGGGGTTVVVQEFGALATSLSVSLRMIPPQIDIERKRGDTTRIIYTVQDSLGSTVDISGWSNFFLTVDPSNAPVDDSNNIGQLRGSLLTDGTDGKVSHQPTGNFPIGEFFYDCQAITASGEKITYAEGAYNIIQDITKN